MPYTIPLKWKKLLESPTGSIYVDELGNHLYSVPCQLTGKQYIARVVADGGSVPSADAVKYDLCKLIHDDVYDGASLILTGSAGGKVGKLYAAKPTTGAGDFTVTRESTRTVWRDGTGYVDIASNVPPVALVDGVWQVMPRGQLTNIFQFSEAAEKPTGSYVISSQIVFDDNDWGIGLDGKMIWANITAINAIYGFIANLNTEFTLCYLIRRQDGNTPVISDGIGDSSSDMRISASALFSASHTKTLFIDDIWFVVHIITLDDANHRFGPAKSQTNSSNTVELSAIMVIEGHHTDIDPYDYVRTVNSAATRQADEIEVTPPAGTTKITEYFADDTTNEITVIPATYELTNGEDYTKIIMTDD